MSLWNWIVVIALIIFFIWCAIYDVFMVYHWIKCFKVFRCTDKKCKFRNFCDKYYDVITEEEYERLMKMIEQL